MAQQLRAHHRRQGQRDEAGDDHRAGQREGEFAKQGAGDAGDEADRRIDRRQRDRHRHHRQRDLVRAADRRVERRHAVFDVAVDVLHHHDRVVDHQADAEHQRQQRQQVDRIAERQQRDHHADQRQRNGDDRNDGRADVADEQEDDDDDDDRRRDQRLGHFVDRGADELGRIVGDGRVEPGGQPRLDAGNHAADAVDHGQRVGLGRAVDADEHRLQPVEGRGRIRVLRPEFDRGDPAAVALPLEDAALA